jgi:hypothetical protein
MLSLFWIVLGALIGVAAAQRKGFSVVAGVVGGALLGPLAVLMFFVSGGMGHTFAEIARQMTERAQALGPSPLKSEPAAASTPSR